MKNAIIHIRTTEERKKRIVNTAKSLPDYTQTRLVEEGIDLILRKAERFTKKGK